MMHFKQNTKSRQALTAMPRQPELMTTFLQWQKHTNVLYLMLNLQEGSEDLKFAISFVKLKFVKFLLMEWIIKKEWLPAQHSMTWDVLQGFSLYFTFTYKHNDYALILSADILMACLPCSAFVSMLLLISTYHREYREDHYICRYLIYFKPKNFGLGSTFIQFILSKCLYIYFMAIQSMKLKYSDMVLGSSKSV